MVRNMPPAFSGFSKAALKMASWGLALMNVGDRSASNHGLASFEGLA